MTTDDQPDPSRSLSEDIVGINISTAIGQHRPTGHLAPLCRIEVHTTGAGMFSADVHPSIVRSLAAQFFDAAQAAETDLALYRLLTERLELSEETAEAMLYDLARFRPADSDDVHPATARRRNARDN